MKRHSNQYSDLELFARLNGSKPEAEEAFAELYARYSPRVYAYCKRVLSDPDEVEDAFQETFVRFFQSGKAERSMTNIPAYLIIIARNVCLNSKRSHRRTTVQFEDFHASINDTAYEKTELLRLITMALELLPHEFREAFVLREYDGFSYQEIADIVGMPLTTVKIRVHRAKQKIREVLTPYLTDLEK